MSKPTRKQKKKKRQAEKVRVQGSLTRCPYCHDDLQISEERWVACEDCLARHHPACWEEGGACSSCSSTRQLVRQPTKPQRLTVRQQVEAEQAQGQQQEQQQEQQQPPSPLEPRVKGILKHTLRGQGGLLFLCSIAVLGGPVAGPAVAALAGLLGVGLLLLFMARHVEGLDERASQLGYANLSVALLGTIAGAVADLRPDQSSLLLSSLMLGYALPSLWLAERVRREESEPESEA